MHHTKKKSVNMKNYNPKDTKFSNKKCTFIRSKLLFVSSVTRTHNIVFLKWHNFVLQALSRGTKLSSYII